MVSGQPRFPGPAHAGRPSLGSSLRQHQFWECPVALAARAQLLAVPQTAVWLLEAPPGMHKQVWQVVCLAALSAMAWGRGLVWGRGGGQPLLPAVLDR